MSYTCSCAVCGKEFQDQSKHRVICDPCRTNPGKIDLREFDGDRVPDAAVERAMLQLLMRVGKKACAITDDDMRAALSKAFQWKLIDAETPKGRKVIAGYFNEAGNWRTIMAKYYLPRTLDWSEDYESGGPEDEDGFAPEGWYEESETHDSILPCKPTHWLPLSILPPAPVP